MAASGGDRTWRESVPSSKVTYGLCEEVAVGSGRTRRASAGKEEADTKGGQGVLRGG